MQSANLLAGMTAAVLSKTSFCDDDNNNINATLEEALEEFSNISVGEGHAPGSSKRTGWISLALLLEVFCKQFCRKVDLIRQMFWCLSRRHRWLYLVVYVNHNMLCTNLHEIGA
jgi:hypothetical protein